MTDTFCPIPWIFQAVRANGDMRVCCQANVTKNQGVIRKEDGSAYNAGGDVLQEARNAEMMKAMRLNMLNGIWSDECGRCKREEDSGLVSRRSYENEHWSYDIEQARSETAQDGSIDIDATPVRYYDLRFGNFCNLKCRMCGPTDSSAWYDDWIELTGKDEFKDTTGMIKIHKTNRGLHAYEFDWPNYEPFWKQLEANAHNIEHVYFAGGEPMLIDRHYEFLQKCIDMDVAKNMIVEYNTNMSTLPPRVANMWTQFKAVRVGASVDGMGAVLEYQRYPAKWDKTLKNLHTLDTMPSNIQSWLAFTVTAYNVEHMIDFMKWKLSESGFNRINSSKRRPIVTHHVAHHPKHLNIRVLPDAVKQTLTEKFDAFVAWVEVNGYPEHTQKQARDIANGVCKYMNSESYYDEHWKEFCNYTRSLDKIRTESIDDVCPNLVEYMI
jgi:hypothetical protein